jgi:hypothetical protein
MKTKRKDRIKELEDQVYKLNKVIKSKDKIIDNLQSRINSTKIRNKDADILKIEKNDKISPIKDNKCPKCSGETKKISGNGFSIITCKCGYRARISEKKTIENT